MFLVLVSVSLSVLERSLIFSISMCVTVRKQILIIPTQLLNTLHYAHQLLQLCHEYHKLF